jgi:hypothetical protein
VLGQQREERVEDHDDDRKGAVGGRPKSPTVSDGVAAGLGPELATIASGASMPATGRPRRARGARRPVPIELEDRTAGGQLGHELDGGVGLLHFVELVVDSAMRSP